MRKHPKAVLLRKHLPKTISSYLGSLLSVLLKAQRKHFLTYLLGLIWIVKFRSIQEIAKQFGKAKTDNLHHFIKDSIKKTERLEEQNQKALAPLLNHPEAVVILDDTLCPRQGRKIEGLGTHYTSTGLLRGLCAVTAIIKIGRERFVWAIRGYRPKKTCTDQPFKSKVQLACQILQQILDFCPNPRTVLVDAWYACAPILNPLVEAGWTFVAAVRNNRVVILDGKKTWASHLAKRRHKYKTIRISKKRKLKVAKVRVYLPQIGAGLLFITTGIKETRFFITNNLDMSESEMVTFYRQRFMIEIFHKDMKQFLGFRELFMRSWQGVQTHWTLVAIAYNTLALWNASQSRSFRQMLSHFRNSVSHDSFMNLPKQLNLPS